MGDEIKEDEVGSKCGTYRRKEQHM